MAYAVRQGGDRRQHERRAQVFHEALNSLMVEIVAALDRSPRLSAIALGIVAHPVVTLILGGLRRALGV